MIQGVDGKNHINCYSKGKTELGKLLTHFAHTPFEYQKEYFESEEAFWYWYITGKQYPELQHYYGYEAKKQGQKYPANPEYWIDEKLLYSVHLAKITQHPHIMKMVCQSTLPFTHHYGDNKELKSTWTGELWNIVRSNCQFHIYKTLQANQVFVFGSNSTGFHGAGTAGQAFRGDNRVSTWRTDSFFLDAVKQHKEKGIHVQGKWAVYGQPQGYQEGTEGKSYAIETIERAGKTYREKDKSKRKKSIVTQLWYLWNFAHSHPELEILMTPVGCGYAGFTYQEMHKVLSWLIKMHPHGTPMNIKNLGCYLQKPDNSLT